VAEELEISNGHAARMRYTRFKHEMEGIRPTGRRNSNVPKPSKEPRSRGRPLGSKNRSKTNDSIAAKDVNVEKEVNDDIRKRKVSNAVKRENYGEIEPVAPRKRSSVAKTAEVAGPDSKDVAEVTKTEGKDVLALCPLSNVEGAKNSPIIIQDDSDQMQVDSDTQAPSPSLQAINFKLPAVDPTPVVIDPILQAMDSNPQLVHNVLHPNFSSQPINHGLPVSHPGSGTRNNLMAPAVNPQPVIHGLPVSHRSSELNNSHPLTPAVNPQPVNYETPIPNRNIQSDGYGMPVVADNFDFGQFGDLGTLPWGAEDAHFDLYEVDYGNAGIYDV
jgi:hypothetical protein